jgi:hypothetical protein
MLISRMFSTGATGLEPATSGVTGRYGATGYNRLRPGITGYSRHFLAGRTGCDRLRPAAARHSLCADVWWSRCQERQHHDGSFDELDDRLRLIVDFML